MRLPDFVQPYLSAQKFSNALSVPLAFKGTIPSRLDFLQNLVKHKTVVHIGCLDHKDLMDVKIAKHQWLHGLLDESATRCLGIDINQEAFNYLQTTHQYQGNIIIADVLKAPLPEVTESNWDYMILGELLEHVDNPVEFLATLRTQYSGTIKQIVVTVPNGFTQTNFKYAQQSKELINSDHRFWFTPYTLARVMNAAGITPHEFFFTNRVPLNMWQLITRKISRLFGVEPTYNFTYASSIVAVGNL